MLSACLCFLVIASGLDTCVFPALLRNNTPPPIPSSSVSAGTWEKFLSSLCLRILIFILFPEGSFHDIQELGAVLSVPSALRNVRCPDTVIGVIGSLSAMHCFPLNTFN